MKGLPALSRNRASRRHCVLLLRHLKVRFASSEGLISLILPAEQNSHLNLALNDTRCCSESALDSVDRQDEVAWTYALMPPSFTAASGT